MMSAQPMSTALQMFLCLSLASVRLTAGHVYLADPPSRNLLKYSLGQENCPHCLQGGGPATVSARGHGTWPTKEAPESHGLCGDPVQNAPVPPSFADEPYMTFSGVQHHYRPGETVEFQVVVSTHHMGHYEFRICNKPLDIEHFDNAADGQDCLDEFVLERAPVDPTCDVNDARGDCQPIDERHPGRWYLPPPVHGWTPQAGSDYDDSQANPLPALSELHIMKYKIPESLTCEKCTLQWYYATGNNCLYDWDYIAHFQGMKSLGWNAELWAPFAVASWASPDLVVCKAGKFGEEFWNCADIAVVGEPLETTATTSGPSTTPAEAGTTHPASTTGSTTTEAATTAVTTSSRTVTTTTDVSATSSTSAGGQCGQLYDQCGGKEFTGALCCAPGLLCEVSNEWYHQCKTGSSSGGGCAHIWQQCGGINHQGPSCCAPGLVCKEHGAWYHQCVQPGSLLAAVARHDHQDAATAKSRRKDAFMALLQTGTTAGITRDVEEHRETSHNEF